MLLASLGYTAATFPWAVLWHAALFKDAYTAFGYFEGEPNFALGFLTVVIQGAVLSFLYPFVRLSGSPLARGLKYAALMGVFFWTCHVPAFIAKQQVARPVDFALLETGYLIVQFGVYGALVGLVYARFAAPGNSRPVR